MDTEEPQGGCGWVENGPSTLHGSGQVKEVFSGCALQILSAAGACLS